MPNVTLPILPRLFPRLLIQPGIERKIGARYIDRLRMRATGVDQLASALSGGNQQKVVLGKWLASEPQVLILDEPTRGIDIGAKVEVHRIISELAASGLAIILISSDLPEVLAMSDRMLVLHEGSVTAEILAPTRPRNRSCSRRPPRNREPGGRRTRRTRRTHAQRRLGIDRCLRRGHRPVTHEPAEPAAGRGGSRAS